MFVVEAPLHASLHRIDSGLKLNTRASELYNRVHLLTSRSSSLLEYVFPIDDRSYFIYGQAYVVTQSKYFGRIVAQKLDVNISYIILFGKLLIYIIEAQFRLMFLVRHFCMVSRTYSTLNYFSENCRNNITFQSNDSRPVMTLPRVFINYIFFIKEIIS